MTIADVREAVKELSSPRQMNWREQLEHIYAHLIEHSQVDPDFRIALGEPKMGRVS